MVLIVDSGSTKTDWIFIDDQALQRSFQSKGLNPITQNTLDNKDFSRELLQCITNAKDIYYYGAGVANSVAASKVSSFLSQSGATGKIHTLSDLVGAARGIIGKDQGIIGILGTGSNAGVYQNGKITHHYPSLGYILGDEGGGVNIGKELLRAYFYGLMPKSLSKLFEAKYTINKDDVLDALYNKRLGSDYLASYAAFLADINHSWKDTLLEQVFMQFIQCRILPLWQIYQLPVSFTGSIAFAYKDLLIQILNRLKIKVGKIEQKPINGLIAYHKMTITK